MSRTFEELDYYRPREAERLMVIGERWERVYLGAERCWDALNARLAPFRPVPRMGWVVPLMLISHKARWITVPVLLVYGLAFLTLRLVALAGNFSGERALGCYRRAAELLDQHRQLLSDLPAGRPAHREHPAHAPHSAETRPEELRLGRATGSEAHS